MQYYSSSTAHSTSLHEYKVQVPALENGRAPQAYRRRFMLHQPAGLLTSALMGVQLRWMDERGERGGRLPAKGRQLKQRSGKACRMHVVLELSHHNGFDAQRGQEEQAGEQVTWLRHRFVRGGVF